MWHYMRNQIKWPTRDEWLAMRGKWEILPGAVGTIDGTLTECYNPDVEPQWEYYSGYARYHCLSTQV